MKLNKTTVAMVVTGLVVATTMEIVIMNLKNIKIPKLLRFTQMKTAIEVGVWFATLAITHSLILSAYSAVMNRIRRAKMEADFKRMMASMEAAYDNAPKEEVVETPAEAANEA